MASSDYLGGSNNVIYTAKGFATGKTVTCFIYDKDVNRSEEIALTELDHGLYYFTSDFFDKHDKQAIYVAVFLEDGVPVMSHAFRTRL